MAQATQDSSQQPIQAHQRLALRSPLIILKVKLEAKRRSFFGYAKNISKGGMFISSVNPHDPGEQFLVELSLPAPIEQQVQCTAEVVWKRKFIPNATHKPGMGLRFLDLPTHVGEAIDDWIIQALNQGKEQA